MMSTGFSVSLPLCLPLSLLLFLFSSPSLRVLLPLPASRYGSPFPVIVSNHYASIPPHLAPVNLPRRGSFTRRGSHALPKQTIVRAVAPKGEICVSAPFWG